MQNSWQIRLANPQDVDAAAAIYESIHDAEERGDADIGWVRGVYPTRQTAADAQKKGELYVLETADGFVAGAAILNRQQHPAYAKGQWLYPAAAQDVLVLHTLVIHPREKGKGFGRAFVAYYEALAAKIGCTALRLDTNAKNTVARALYRQCGYREAGVVPTTFHEIDGVQLVLLEKPILRHPEEADAAEIPCQK